MNQAEIILILNTAVLIAMLCLIIGSMRIRRDTRKLLERAMKINKEVKTALDINDDNT